MLTPTADYSAMSRFLDVVLAVVSVVAVLAVLFASTAWARQTAVPDGPRVIDVVATRYAFEPAEIEVGAGETVRLMVRSGDGLHGFEIKALKIKKELPRGAAPIAIEFTPATAGRYPILCSEFCGDGHADMKGALVVVARDAGAAP